MTKLTDGIKQYKNVIPSGMCDEFISLFDKCDATKFDNQFYIFDQVNMMDSPEYSAHMESLADIMSSVHNRYAKDFGFFPETDSYEAPRIKRYKQNSGVFNWHTDACTTSSCDRILVMFFYLNTVEKGGETVFDFNGKKTKVKPLKGSVLCFPPTWQYPHMGSIPISGPKYVISSYVKAPKREKRVSNPDTFKLN